MVSTSTAFATIIPDLILMFRAKRPLYLRHMSGIDETIEKGVSNQGGGRQQSFTQAAPNELKLDEGGVMW